MKVLFLCLTMLYAVHAGCQSLAPCSVLSSGADYTSNSLQIDIAIGEPLADTYNAATNILTTGFIQNNLLVTRKLILKFFLEGLYAGNNEMFKASDGFGDQFPGNTADQIRIGLHSRHNYLHLLHASELTNLATSGIAEFTIPGALFAPCYLSIHHRNSIETVSALPLNLSGMTVYYDFSDRSSRAFGDNMKNLAGVWGIYAGDVNQDGAVDGLDMIPVDNQASAFGMGYIPEDINGDGSVDALDMILLDNNAASFIAAVTP
jgi:hypothetical protein